MLGLLTSDYEPILSSYEIFKNISLEDFEPIATIFLNEIKLKALIQGNLDANIATAVTLKMISTLNLKPIKDVSHIREIIIIEISLMFICYIKDVQIGSACKKSSNW